jgi:hypothetical protein
VILELYFFEDGEELNGPYKAREEALVAEEIYGKLNNSTQAITDEEHKIIQDIHQRNTALRNKVNLATQ